MCLQCVYLSQQCGAIAPPGAFSYAGATAATDCPAGSYSAKNGTVGPGPTDCGDAWPSGCAFAAVLESIAGRRPVRDILKPLYLAQIELVFHDS